MKLLAPLLMLCGSSCTLPCTMYNAQTGEHVTLGGSLATKTTKESAFAVSASGTVLGYNIDGKDETLGPKYYFMWQTVGEIANAARQAYSSANATKRALGAQQVQRVGINADRAVRLKALEPVLPEVAPTIPTVP